MELLNEFGSFINDGYSYKIDTPYTPRRYDNVITNPKGYLAEISQWGTGTASLQFEDGETNTIINGDQKTIYIRNEKTGEVWNPGVYPMMSKVEDFSCVHHDTYTEVSSVYGSLKVIWRVFVLQDDAGELWTITVENNGSDDVEISVVPALRPLLTGFKAPRFFDEQYQYSICSFDDKLNGMYYEAGNPNPKNSAYNAFLVSSKPVVGYCGEGERFLGAPLAMQYPETLLMGRDLGQIKGIAGENFMSLQTKLCVKAGGIERVDFVFGVAQSREAAAKMSEYLTCADETVKNAVGSIRKKREQLIINTPNEKLNIFVNMWIKKGLEYGMRKKDANRDNLQFADGLTMSDAKRVKHELRRVFAWQYKDGHTLRSFVPLDEVEYCDGPLWLVITTCGYLKFSGDREFLTEKIKFYNGGEATVLEHLETGLERIHTQRGPNGLPLLKFADWNDALNLPDKEAESVFMAMGYAYMLREMSELYKWIGNNEKAEVCAQRYEQEKERINNVAWDEDAGYYVRGFCYGKPVGTAGCDGAVIFINPQTWSILSGIVTKDRLERVLKAIDGMETEVGFPVNLPAFDKFDSMFGRTSAQIPGTWENGSSYCHVTSFKANADVIAGRGDEALRSILSVMPDQKSNPVSKSGATPFALTSSFSTHPEIFGKAGRPWLTGTQSWFMRACVEGLLGIKRAYDGFEISPAFPTTWDKAECSIMRNDSKYIFKIERTGSFSVTVDGNAVVGNFVPFVTDDIKETVVYITV